MQQGRIFDIINEMIKEKAGLETKEAQELKKTLAESNKGDLMDSEGLADTIGVMRFLWHHWVSEGQKHIIINNLVLSSPKCDVETIAVNLACFLAGVHDVGKCTPMFQTQKGYSNSLDLVKMRGETLIIPLWGNIYCGILG